MQKGSGSEAALNALVSVRDRTIHRVTELEKDDAKRLLFLK